MGVAGHHGLGVLGSDLAQSMHEVEHQCSNLLDFTADIQTHVERDLIVSRACGVQTLARVTDALG